MTKKKQYEKDQIIGSSGFSESFFWAMNVSAEAVYWNTKLGIPDFAFTHCTALRSVTLPESLTSIGGAAFSGCRSLKEIYIPSSVGYIDARAFDNIPELTIKGEKYSYAYYYAKAQKIPFQCIGEAENPVTNRPIIASIP